MTQSIDLSVVIPAFNEERRLPLTLIHMLDFLGTQPGTFEIVVVDDGSTDRTVKLCETIAKLCGNIRVISLERNSGKGAAVRNGVLASKGNTVLMADADGAAPIEELVRLQTALHHGADIAIGSRALSSPEIKLETLLHRKLLGRVFNGLVNLLVIPDVADTQCGFKLFTRDAAQKIFARQKLNGFSFDVEVLYLAKRLALTVKEVAVNWTNIPGSRINLVVDSAKMFIDILKIRWLHHGLKPR